MFRKFILATAAVAALGAASLTASTPAAAWGWHHHYHHGFGWGGYHRFYNVGYSSCWRNVWRVNRFGETVLRRVYVCY